LLAIGAEHRVAAEVGGLVQQLGFAAAQGHGHQVVAAPLLHHADPALARAVDQAVGEGAPGVRVGQALWFTGWGSRLRIKAAVPEAAVAIVHPHQIGALHDVGAAAVFVHPAAQIPVARGELDCGLGLFGRRHQQGGAAALMGPLLQPEQPASVQQRLLDAGGATHHRLG
jgi:hypothetical protein